MFLKTCEMKYYVSIFITSLIFIVVLMFLTHDTKSRVYSQFWL